VGPPKPPRRACVVGRGAGRHRIIAHTNTRKTSINAQRPANPHQPRPPGRPAPAPRRELVFPWLLLFVFNDHGWTKVASQDPRASHLSASRILRQVSCRARSAVSPAQAGTVAYTCYMGYTGYTSYMHTRDILCSMVPALGPAVAFCACFGCQLLVHPRCTLEGAGPADGNESVAGGSCCRRRCASQLAVRACVGLTMQYLNQQCKPAPSTESRTS